MLPGGNKDASEGGGGGGGGGDDGGGGGGGVNGNGSGEGGVQENKEVKMSHGVLQVLIITEFIYF